MASAATAAASAATAASAASAAASSSTPCWPPQRSELSLLSIRILSVHHLPTRGEHRPALDAIHHAHVPELSGPAVPPSCGSISSPSLCLSVHPIGGFAAIAPSLELLKRTGGGSFSQRMRSAPCGARGGLSVGLDVHSHCLVAEPMESVLRVALLDGETEVAYEAVVVGVLRHGYRCIPLRDPTSGSFIDGCALLVHIERSSAPSAWVDDHEELRKTIARQQAIIDEQRQALAKQAAEIAMLRADVPPHTRT